MLLEASKVMPETDLGSREPSFISSVSVVVAPLHAGNGWETFVNFPQR